MVETMIKDSQTVIYVGGGNFMTQARPTNFHSFWTEKRLLPGESVGGFREVTAAERAALEKSDAAWQEPPQAFVEWWEARCALYRCAWRNGIGGYNRETGFFELNGILDLTYAEAMRIDLFSPSTTMDDVSRMFRAKSSAYRPVTCRTYFPVWVMEYGAQYVDAWQGNTGVEVLRFMSYYGNSAGNGPNFKGAFNGCTALRDAGSLSTAQTDANTFKDCESLEMVKITLYGTRGWVYDFRWSPRLSYESMWQMAGWVADKGTVTVTLHPEAYARVDEALLERATAAGVTFVTPE